jgi:glutamyl-tRNA reductase
MMLNILLLGLNHKTAPVALRECLAFSAAESDAGLETLGADPAVAEAIIISTCNRIEILMTTEEPALAWEAAKNFISQFKQIPKSQFEDNLYFYEGDEAVRHLFRVAASLDSMMVGEPQILGQLKEAYRTATTKKTSGAILNRLLHRTFFVAKRVRSETGIGDHAVSISYAAVELAKKIFGNLEGKKILLIGAGEMAELAVEHLIRNRSGDILVANRTFERGLELAGKFKGQALRFEEIPDCLAMVDIIISSTAAVDFIIHRQQLKTVMRGRRNRPIFFIDIAVPRNIDPKINRLNNAYVYDIDDLKGVIDENIEDRQREAIKAERLIDEAVIQFRKWYQGLEVVPTIVALREKVGSLADVEITKILQSLGHLSEADRAYIQKGVVALVNKILHDPTHYLKSDGCRGNKSISLDITRKLFKID